MWTAIREFVQALVSRPRLEREFDAELRDHLERDVEARLRRGLPPAEARRQALADLGGVERTKDEVRDVHAITLIDALRRDLRFATRRMLRQKGYAALTVFTIALGTGAATAVFTVVDGVLLQPLPFTEPDRLVTIAQVKLSEAVTRDDVPPATYLDWRQRVRGLVTLSAGNPWSVNLRGASSTDRVEAWQVSEEFFAMVGVIPHLGRLLQPSDFTPGGARVVVLDHGFWQRRFGSDPAIIGRSLRLDDHTVEVVGVMPPGFELPAPTGMWMPWIPVESQRTDRFGTYIKVFARLAPGVSLAQANDEMATVARDLEREYPRSNSGVGATVSPLLDVMVGAHRGLLWTLLGASAVLLLVTLANIAALHLTRVARQRRETAIRVALGAGRGGVARPLVAESVLLAVLGGGVGVGVAWASVRLLHAAGPSDLPRLASVALDARALGMVVLLSACAAVVLSVIAVGRSAEVTFGTLATRTVAGSRLARRGRQGAVAAQLALSLVLLIGTSLLVRSFQRVLAADRGYDSNNVLSFTVWVYDEYPTAPLREQFARRVLDRMRELPGVRHAAVGSALPLAEPITGEEADVVMEGTSVPLNEEPRARGIAAWPSYFETLQMQLRRGRLFDDSDNGTSERVVVVNEAFVRRHSPDRDPIGRMVSVGLMGRGIPRRIIGVVGDTRHVRLDVPPEPGVYIPWLQQPIAAMSFVVRTDVPPETLTGAVAKAMFEIDDRLGVAHLTTMNAQLDQRLRARRFLVLLLATFAGIAIALAGVGVFGVMNQSVVERSREIGVRLALGATPRAITRELSREALWLAVGGVLVGGALAIVGVRAIAGFLFEVAPFDLVAISGAVILLLATTIAATVWPALRAVRTDPVSVLRDE